MPILTPSERSALRRELDRTGTTYVVLARATGKGRAHVSQGINGKFAVASETYRSWMDYLKDLPTVDRPGVRRVSREVFRDLFGVPNVTK